ncbi:Phosphatidylinositol transfer protein CSR1, putative [Perkinsus marinus ATCC 50983]|uniref:Phosphatidylinositol transfer protein CSR1, putative n=1 Tax=Perkinsus marinus (strain ATCC 50983 / TXsc) TaxID=423536 RepID=C5KF63_PERM5|nr:Phosphatidylinositol transfer protein CSR1, putative [Perkinsus marinus ATCC 50983]EER16865.1 Phosphatidylinositol transfer protein CSR1, putative [Perkinsus marinus ATCC 50983]|eukprot:XP_002785069.1 Phosphatidylinositol transfer protein CSR1, putative [Perkinsus marinus ATCC 50983]
MIQKALPERLRSKYAVALSDAGRVDTWEPVFAGRGSHISVKKQSRGTKLRLVQLIDGFNSDRVWRELKEGSFGSWMSRIDGCYYQPITTIAYDDDTSITTDYASLFVEDEYFSRIKMHVDLVRALIDKRKQIVATTSEESFEGVGKRVEVDYMFWTVEDLPNGRGSAITCIVSIAPPENQKDISVQRVMKYLLPNLRCARSVVTRIFKGRYNRSGNPFHDVWFRHIWKLEDFLNSAVKKCDFLPGRNDPCSFEYSLTSGKARDRKSGCMSGQKISETEETNRVLEMQTRIEKTAAETGQVCPTESECRRFLEASGWEVDAAFAKLRDTLAWRLTTFGIGHPPRGIDPDSISAERRKGSLYLRGRDKLKRPILVFRARLYEPRQTNLLEYERYLVYCIERCISKLVNEGSKKETQELTVLADMSGCGYNNFDVPSTKSVVKLLAGRYPGRIGCVWVTNLNWAGKQFWSIIRPFFSEETLSRLQLVPRDDPVGHLSRFIDPKNIPAFCGGIDSYVYSIENDDLFSDDEEVID